MFDDYSVMRFRWALLFGLLAACTKPNPASCADDFCSDPALPFCDVDGSIGGVADTCIAVSCEPNTFESCRDENHALICSGDGANFQLTECEFGCGDEGCLPCNTPECIAEKHIIPRYVPTSCDDVETTTLAVTEDFSIDTSDDSMCTEVIPQVNAPDICVIHHESITIATNKTLTVTGRRTVALVADRTFEVSGTLDASAGFANGDSFNGPGGGFKNSGLDSGGAGYRTPGGSGGNNTTDGGAANGGPKELSPTEIAVLLGGPRPTPSTRITGGGGGGVTMVCCRCTLSISGILDVNGGAGFGTATLGNGTQSAGASGGGAGGTIVLQGLDIEMTGQAFANGGGGGSGATIFSGIEGQEGPRSTMCALGGVPSGSGGRGGAGGCLGAAPENGRFFAGTSQFTPGAGGGSAGFLLTYTPTGVTPNVSPLAASPAFEPNNVIPTN